MSYKRPILVTLAILALGALAYYYFSVYLVSKLDGTGEVQTPVQTLEQYASEDGYSFKYPNTYNLSSRTEGNAERQWDVLLLIDKGYVAPVDGEGPTAISVGVFSNMENQSLEQWVKGDARSNYKLSATGALTPGTVGGEPALFYNHSGLYEFDSVAVIHGGKIFLFEASWTDQNQQIRSDFTNLVNSVSFQ